MNESATTVLERLKASLDAACAHNPNDADPPATILWTDRDSQWLPIVPRLRGLVPHLLTLGEYEREQHTGPSIWLRCVIDGGLELPEIPSGSTPVIYLPGVDRQELGAAEACRDWLKPLVELQYRGVCWTQKNGRDWTLRAFLVSKDGGLGLDLARDAATRHSMHRALTELAATPLRALQGKRLEAEDFDRLFSDDPIRDVLVWLNDPEGVRAGWDLARWSAFASRCNADFRFDPEKDGAIDAAELLGRREGRWRAVWERFAESPSLFPDLPERLRPARPHELFVEESSWPQINEQRESVLRDALSALANVPAAAARERVIELENNHGERRNWVWAKLGLAPLAGALGHLAAVAERSSKELGGASVSEMAKLYTEGAWEADAAALKSMAAVKSTADTQAVSRALDAIYRPWLEAAAQHLQTLAEKEPLPGQGGEDDNDARVGSGGAVLFADGLRLDVARRLVERERTQGRSVSVTTRWAALPTVTATAKPAVSPVAECVEGASLGENFLPVVGATQHSLTTARFRRLLASAGYQYLRADEVGDPAGRAWTENGELDKLGHSLQGRLAARIDDQIELLRERIGTLLDAGWREVRVVTDHGWLWLPGGLPKVTLPKYLTESRWARCAAIKGESTVEMPVVSWHWNAHERVAVGPGIACFGAGNKYAHGGLSLQESLVPVLRITAGARTGSEAATRIAAVTWAGLRCRVQIDPPAQKLTVDLRTRVGDADSSATGPRLLDTGGAASLLVEDDDMEGIPAAVVVLDAGGQVVARQSTIIGGDS